MTTSTPPSGRLYGVGVGPGDPELLTFKAHRIIRAAPVVAFIAAEGTPSRALAVAAAAGALAPGVERILIETPMRESRAPARAIYDSAAPVLAARLAEGKDVAFLCEGDPLFYGSFMYMLERLRGHPATVVPGVSSPMAAAAAALWPLCSREEAFASLPATLPEDDLRARLAMVEAAAIMKLGRHMAKVRRVLEALGLGRRAVYVSEAGGAAQVVAPLHEAPDPAPYFSMVLVRKGEAP